MSRSPASQIQVLSVQGWMHSANRLSRFLFPPFVLHTIVVDLQDVQEMAKSGMVKMTLFIIQQTDMRFECSIKSALGIIVLILS